MSLKRLSFIAALALMFTTLQAAVPSKLNYNVVYKWGFIEKVAGHGTVSLEIVNDTLHGTLDGHSIPWGGRLYSVRDTLVSRITPADGSFAQQVQYQNGWYTKPEVGQSMAGLLDNPANYRTIDGCGTLSADAATIEAVTITSDMLGFFYLVQLIDFDKMQEGDTLHLPIDYPDGHQRSLDITYNGPATNDDGAAVYDVVFNYSYDGQMSAYPVESIIDAQSRIPLSIAAHLLIGHMEMVYVPA